LVTHGLTVIGRTHGLADDALVLDRIFRSQSRPPDQAVIIGAPDARVSAIYVPRTGSTALDLQHALLRARGTIVVVLDSSYDVYADHLETMVHAVEGDVLPRPVVYGVDGQERHRGGLVQPGTTLPAFRLGEALGVGGFWPLLDRSDGPEMWGVDLYDRIAAKYQRRVVDVPVHARAVPGRSSPRMREEKCGLSVYALGKELRISANRAVPREFLEKLRQPCPAFDTAESSCSLLDGPCTVPWAAFGMSDQVIGWARSLPAGRLRRAWHAQRVAKVAKG
jgi:hypothetical protein